MGFRNKFLIRLLGLDMYALGYKNGKDDLLNDLKKWVKDNS